MSQPTVTEIHSLYRSFCRLQRRWPRQDARPARLRDHLLAKIRTEFRQPGNVSTRYQHGQRELTHLERILESKIEQEFALPETSPIITFLPTKKTYTLLDQEAQDTLEEKGTVSYLKDYLASKFER
ncbi:hypothetical protein PhCBS80983_g00698 [Powellomyces hirtus]|uniref:Mitochondrial zinc maintenance protein 1, mitochondrial n=1 Tax=Powellomyces hirtus TaxID=109895 RepID=A0A507EFI5_9FUNG|nr:hypothetical protein DFJ77DRAFT_472404 [Powellomyces hirtus]TPX62175.1 hypothetical protein PhCBS80983_g00698 [Powellomyces hirtus]